MGRISKETMLRALKRKGAEGTSQEHKEKRSKRSQDGPQQPERSNASSDEVVEVKDPTSAKMEDALVVASQARKGVSSSGAGGPALGDPDRSTRRLLSALLIEDLRTKKEQPSLIGYSSSMAGLYEVLSGLVALQEKRAFLENQVQDLTRLGDIQLAKEKEMETLMAQKDSKIDNLEGSLLEKEEEILSYKNEIGPLRGVIDELTKLVEIQKEEIDKAAAKAVAQFRSSEEYEDELSLECVGSYKKGFKECKTMVREKFPNVDTSLLVCELGEDEEGEEKVPPAAAEVDAASSAEAKDIAQPTSDGPQA